MNSNLQIWPPSLFQSIPKCYIENLKGHEFKCYWNWKIEDLKFDFSIFFSPLFAVWLRKMKTYFRIIMESWNLAQTENLEMWGFYSFYLSQEFKKIILSL